MKISICNQWSINNAGLLGLNRLYTKYYRLTTNCPLHLSRTLYKSALFMQNKPNFRKAKMNVNSFITKDYIKNDAFAVRKNKPNSNPNKPNLPDAQMNVNKVLTKDYENISNWTLCENKPNQTQSQDPNPKGVNWFDLGVFVEEWLYSCGQVGKILTCQIGNKV